MTYNQKLADAAVLQRLDLLRTEGELVQIVISQYLRVARPILQRLTDLHRRADSETRVFSLAERQEIAALRRQLSAETRALHTQMRQTMYETLRASARTTAVEAATALRDLAPPALAEAVLAPSLVDVTQAVMMPVGGLRWTDRLARDLVQWHDQLQAVLGDAVAQGASMPRVAESIRAATGITETYRGRLVAIARTEVQRVSNAGAMVTYQANSDIIKGYQWLATLDDRTCVVCGSLHEREWALDDPAMLIPPAHPRCRCFAAPVTRTWNELGLGSDANERRELDGRAAVSMDFDSWLTRQGEDTQRSVLGTADNYERWRAGETLASIAAPGVAQIR